ncbi:MAG: haloacid dehalogenase-like hydrolase [Candidatus Bathyarchaeia archaeon]
MKDNRLVVFDVEGIIIPKRRFLLFEVFANIGFKPFLITVLLGVLYTIGILPLKTTMKILFRQLEGLPEDEFIDAFQNIDLSPNVKKVFKRLRGSGLKIALISSGVPYVALKKLGEKLQPDYIDGPRMGVNNGLLTGEIGGTVIEEEGKATALKQLLEEEKLLDYEVIAVADDRNNVSLFKISDLKIGYNPDFILHYRSDRVVRGDITKILPLIIDEDPCDFRKLSNKFIIRKLIHASGFIIPIFIHEYLDERLIILFTFIGIFIYIASETFRIFGMRDPIFSRITLMATSEQEARGMVTAPIFYALGVALSFIIFPQPVAKTALTVLALGDSCAAIIGRRFGSHRIPINEEKSWEGTIAGLTTSFIASTLFVDPYRALLASICGILVEVVPLPLNDDLLIPIAAGSILLIF